MTVLFIKIFPAHQYNAKVPGSIYTDLSNAGLLQEDIYKDFNDVKYRWVSYMNWTYHKHFNCKFTDTELFCFVQLLA